MGTWLSQPFFSCPFSRDLYGSKFALSVVSLRSLNPGMLKLPGLASFRIKSLTAPSGNWLGQLWSIISRKRGIVEYFKAFVGRHPLFSKRLCFMLGLKAPSFKMYRILPLTLLSAKQLSPRIFSSSSY